MTTTTTNNMTDNDALGVASLPTNDLPDPDEDFPDLTFGEENTLGFASLPDPDDPEHPSNFVKPDLKKGASFDHNTQSYILGTLVVRVVAARNLEPVQAGGGLGQMVFGGNHRLNRGTANPYASVKFGHCQQRSSEVFDTLDPIWPRQETMFMDVSLPQSELAHPRPNDPTREQAAAMPTSQDDSSSSSTYKKPSTTLTVALFHTSEIGKVNKYPNKGVSLSGDSDDIFLGMASIDMTKLFTGMDRTIDEWLPLSGVTEGSNASVRIVCEYEPSDSSPRPGDYCRFTTFCHPRDLFPLEPGRQYCVAEVHGDTVLISYTSQEGWVCSFEAHRYMLVCEERHHSTVEVAQDELASLAEKLSHSPLLHSVTETVERVAVDGLLSVGEEIVHGGFSLFNRWMSGGVQTIVSDVTHVTNWDGRYNPDDSERLNLPDVDDASDSHEEENETAKQPANSDKQESSETDAQALPNMPCCPITSEPMIDPVVAADGKLTVTDYSGRKSPKSRKLLFFLIPYFFCLRPHIRESSHRTLVLN